MKCGECGSTLHPTTTDLPFKVSEQTIVILTNLPVAQCDACREYLIADPVFARVEELFGRVNGSVEPEIIQFAASSRNSLESAIGIHREIWEINEKSNSLISLISL
jgi:YgiT-type zinc finger domain-containing protein